VISAQVYTAGFYDDAGVCDRCDVPYCYQHWSVSSSGLGTCLRGDAKSLDSHRSPEWLLLWGTCARAVLLTPR
jgi:hypothetical protein